MKTGRRVFKPPRRITVTRRVRFFLLEYPDFALVVERDIQGLRVVGGGE